MLRPKKGRKDATVYAEPYWFDESQSLVELHGLSTFEGVELVTPVGSLSIAQLELLLRQGTDAHYLAPIAIARLRGELGDGEKLLLRHLLELGDFWDTHPYLRAQLEPILQAHLARHPHDRALQDRVARFLQLA